MMVRQRDAGAPHPESDDTLHALHFCFSLPALLEQRDGARATGFDF